MHKPESQLLELETSDCKLSKKQIVLYICALWWCYLFSPSHNISLQSALGLQLFLKCNKSEKPVWRKSQNVKNSERSHKENRNDMNNEQDGHENKAQIPRKNLEWQPICSLHKKSFLAADEISMCSLILWECNKIFAIQPLSSWTTAHSLVSMYQYVQLT